MTFPTVVIAEYDPQWPELFEEEKKRVLGVIGDRVVAVEHTGSTAVPRLAAKPIIDIVGGVRGLAYATEACMEPLRSIGYEHVPRPGLTDRELFRRGAWLIGTMYHLHLVEHGEVAWERHLRFRDALRARPRGSTAVRRPETATRRRVQVRPRRLHRGQAPVCLGRSRPSLRRRTVKPEASPYQESERKMRERLEQRLQELRAEFEKGEQTLQELETQAATVRQTLLRISGAIQVLEEALGDADEPQRSETEATGQADDGVAARVEQTTGEDGLRLTAER